MKITLISDTHNKHKQITSLLKGGDILIHSGDFTSMGYKEECESFLEWFSKLPYRYKVFICGNHELGVEKDPEMLSELINKHQSLIEEDLIYLNDNMVNIEGLNIYGSPITPYFYNWAFNRHPGDDIQKHWDMIPNNVDILVTHGPVYGINDQVIGRYDNLGCNQLLSKVQQIKPLIHTCGHIHSGNGYKEFNDVNYFNAAVLNEQYYVEYKPWNIELSEENDIWVIKDVNYD